MPPSRYQSTLDWLYGLEAARGIDFKLERVELALQHLGAPHRRFRSIHVAGTNGKGSVSAMAHSVLLSTSRRVGLYTSPHLVDFRERIRVDGRPIDESSVIELAEQIRAETISRGIDLTFFELTTILAFLYFAQQRVDVAVVEVGLGGRLDATNVLETDVAVITSIGMDHQEFLGTTLASVAAEKAGIIKEGGRVIVGRVANEASHVIAAVAARQRASIDWYGSDFALVANTGRFFGLGREIVDVDVPLAGSFQVDNAAVAIAALLSFDPQLSDDTIRAGIRNTAWPGRMQWVHRERDILLDCAHNPDGMRALVDELARLDQKPGVHALFAVMRDKQWREMIRVLGPRLRSATVTSVLPPRGERAEAVAAELRQYVPVEIADTPALGLEELLRRVPEGDIVLVTGSLFLVGAVLPSVLIADEATAPGLDVVKRDSDVL